MNFGVVVFPGSNCDDDMMHVLGSVMGCKVDKIWHKDTSLGGLSIDDCVIIPGGFSYGDYLRSGAVAKFSPIMKEVIQFANAGGKVWGICNGFQVLCEAGLLPGVLLRNINQKFICKNIYLRTETTDSLITRLIEPKQVLKIPIAHADGRYFASPEVIQDIEDHDQVLFRYSTVEGEITETSNVNGSVNNIAGICNINRNVFGMMPHPERAAESILGNVDGRLLFESLLNTVLV